jgi:CBS domain-containing protein
MEMEIKTLLKDRPTTIESDASLRRARELLERSGARALPVLHGGELVGILTEGHVRRAGRSIVPAFARQDWASLLHRISVAQLMGPVAATVAPATTVQEAARVMALLGLDLLPVIDDGALIGTITSDDVLDYVVDTLRHARPAGFDHILAVCELTENDVKVVATSRALVRDRGARLTLLHPLPPLDRLLGPDGVGSILLASIREARIRNAMECLRALVPAGAEYRVVTGDGGGAIVEAASQVEADLIVMNPAVRGRFGIRESDLDEVVRRAPCPVLMVGRGA